MEELIKQYKETGPCEVHVDKVVSSWDDRFSISQWHEEYRLIEQLQLLKEEAYGVTISKQQAEEIITKSKLLPVKSTMFRNAKTWRNRENIVREKDRIEGLLKDKEDPQEIRVLSEIVREFEEALKHI